MEDLTNDISAKRLSIRYVMIFKEQEMLKPDINGLNKIVTEKFILFL